MPLISKAQAEGRDSRWPVPWHRVAEGFLDGDRLSDRPEGKGEMLVRAPLLEELEEAGTAGRPDGSG